MKLYYLLILSFLVTGCPFNDDKPDYYLYIRNESSLDLMFQYDEQYPDTTLWEANPFTNLNYEDFILLSGTSDSIPFTYDELDAMGQNEKLRFFLFDKEVIDSLPWDTIRDSYLILDRYFLGFEDMERNDWTIAYP